MSDTSAGICRLFWNVLVAQKMYVEPLAYRTLLVTPRSVIEQLYSMCSFEQCTWLATERIVYERVVQA
jgi:hypothetical protein